MIPPGTTEDPPRNFVTEFYQSDNMFSLKPETLKQLTTVYKAEEKPFNVVFAASFFIVPVEDTIVAFLEVIRTSEKAKGQGHGSALINHIKEYVQTELDKSRGYESALFIVG